MIPLPTERTGPAEEEGDHCEDDGISKESLLRGDLSQELDGETLRWLPYLHSPLTGSVNLCWNESGQQVLEAVRADTAQRLHGGEVPHLDRALLQHQALINEIATMREDNWSPEPVFHWGQLGYEGKNPAGRWQAPTKQLPELGTNIVPPTISALLTFAVNPQHLNYRRSAMIGSEPQSNYTMALLASVGSSYSLAPNLFVSDANFYSMPSSTKVPYRGEKTTKMFESGFAWSLATNISIYILFGGSNKYRFAITHKAELQHAVDMGSTLAAPSIGIQLEGRWRIFLFGPHPCAASCEFPVLKKLPLHTAAFQALHRLAAAIEFIIHAKWPVPPVKDGPVVGPEPGFPESAESGIYSARRRSAELAEELPECLHFPRRKFGWGTQFFPGAGVTL
ncbi:hypothetical protein CF319_g5795 [Tilletia indica]|nr:hypothetical protein CF319_g5795 [Tilletia indica]